MRGNSKFKLTRYLPLAKDFADYRRKKPTPCMEGLRFQRGGRTAPAIRILSDAGLETVAKEGAKEG